MRTSAFPVQMSGGSSPLRLTDFDPEAVQTGDENPGPRQAAHHLAAVDRELPAVQVFIDVH